MSGSKENDDAPVAVSDTQILKVEQKEEEEEEEEDEAQIGNPPPAETTETEAAATTAAAATAIIEDKDKDKNKTSSKEEDSKKPHSNSNSVSVSVDHKTTIATATTTGSRVDAKTEASEPPNPNSQAQTQNDNGNGIPTSKDQFFIDDNYLVYEEGSESGAEEDQSNFMKELELFFKERSLEFKPPKFYGEGLNCLKLWRAVTRLGGYDKVTSCKLWRQVGESFKPPKTCTTVSWTFRGFYEKALLDYERHKTRGGELSVPVSSHAEPSNVDTQASGSGRARRDAAARAMQGWHSQRLLGNGEVSDPIIKLAKISQLQIFSKLAPGLLKRKKQPYTDHAVKATRTKASKTQLDTAVVDVGPPAEWVKINVQRTKDCYEVYALVPGLLREEVRVQSDPAGRLVISGEPEQPDNPWGVTPFKKVVSLPSRIDPHQTSAVVTLHGQLFVRVPFEQSE
ncbi:AT-rich interactive domain-containing protein 3 [Morus notabilis]|uniref:AT-rich interactive domain-containing protein 3 n=1 Tax=Morus notabilis TaxID=981085 RepID=W9S9N4_9ROSA|nr:AT-rich interactive domain-containing protein 3 [Morus notabilis]